MNTTEIFQALTLWFVAMIFLQTGSGDSNPVLLAAAFVAFGLTVAIPLYLIVGISSELLE